MRSPRVPDPRSSLAKLALSVLAGCAVAALIVTRPLTAPLPNTLLIADMTWPEVRSAIEHGYTTVIVPSGGVEQNGPHMIVGKHDYIVRFTAERIATELGHALVAPVVSFVPEGDFVPASGHLRFPGTIGVSPDVFAGILEGIARSLKGSGFHTICFIADHGESQKPQREVAARLSREWAGDRVAVLSVDDYYADEAQTKFLLGQGETLSMIGHHAGITDTAELLAVHPEGVKLDRLSAMPFTFAETGNDGAPVHASPERGKALLDIKIKAAVRQIRASLPSE